MNYLNNIVLPYINPRHFVANKKVMHLSESSLLALSFGIALMAFCANSLDLLFSKFFLYSGEEVGRFITSFFVISLFFIPIFLYMLSALFHGFLWVIYRVGPMRHSRLTFFWALFLCFPIQIVLTVIVNLFGNIYVSNILNFGMLIYFIWLWSVFDCEIFKLNSLWQIMLARILFVIISFGVIFTL